MREQVCGSHADAGGGAGKLSLRLPDIGAPAQQVEGQTGLHFGRNGRHVLKASTPDHCFRILTEQYRDGVLGRLHLGNKRRELRPKGGKLPFGKGEVEGVGEAAFVARAHEVERLPGGIDAPAGRGQLHLQTPHIQIAPHDIGNHRDEHAVGLGRGLCIVADRFQLYA